MRAILICAAAVGIFIAPSGAEIFPYGQSIILGDATITDFGNGSWSQCANSEHRRPAQQAIAACGRLIADRMSRQDTSAALYYRGLAYEDAGDRARARSDFDRAMEVATALIQSRPHWAYAYNSRAHIRYHLEDYERALADYDAAIVEDAHSAYPHYGRGLILFRRGEYANAAREFDTAQHLAVSESQQDYSSTRCESRAAAGTEFAAAESACDHAIRDSASSSSFVSRGYLRFMQGNVEAANTDFTEAVRRDGRNPTALYGRGVTSVRLGRTGEGQADIARARDLDTNSVDYYANAGLRP